MDIDTLVAGSDPARHITFGGPESAEASRLYEQITRQRRLRWQITRPRGRLLFAATAGALSAGLAAGLTIAALPGSSNSAAPSAASGPGRTAHATLTARQVLNHAAAAALTQPMAAPRPSQFLYLKQINAGSGPSDGATQSWVSVDGMRNGLTEGPLTDGRASVIYGCVDGRQVVTGLRKYKGPRYTGPDSASVPCTAVPGYLPDLPTRPADLLSYLEKEQAVRPGNLDDLAKAADGLLGNTYLLPAQRAALYRLLAQTPGFTAVAHATDIAGRHGVGIEWTGKGSTTEIIFDARSYAYLGLVGRNADGSRFGESLLTTAIVNQAGQLP